MRILFRNMRKHSALDSLISHSTQEIMTAILVERENPWYLSDLAKRLHRTPSTLTRPLASLHHAGIIRRWVDGNRIYFARDPDCPFLPDLQQLIIKTIGLVDVLIRALRPFSKKTRVAFIYGSIARSEERSQSDVDVFVIGSETLSSLTPALSKAEKHLRRPVNAVVVSPPEFAARVKSKSHFLQTILVRPKIFLVGTSSDLERIAREANRRSPQDR